MNKKQLISLAVALAMSGLANANTASSDWASQATDFVSTPWSFNLYDAGNAVARIDYTLTTQHGFVTGVDYSFTGLLSNATFDNLMVDYLGDKSYFKVNHHWTWEWKGPVEIPESSWSSWHSNYLVKGTSVDYSVTAVPEPETYAMLLAGLGVLGAVTRRRRIG